MKNKYEFNAEDINKIIVVTNDSTEYTYQLIRKFNEDGSPTMSFETRHTAKSYKTQDDLICSICPYCGIWNYIAEDLYNSGEFECDCNSEKVFISEEEAIEFVLSLMNEKDFDGITIIINDIVIE